MNKMKILRFPQLYIIVIQNEYKEKFSDCSDFIVYINIFFI